MSTKLPGPPTFAKTPADPRKVRIWIPGEISFDATKYAPVPVPASRPVESNATEAYEETEAPRPVDPVPISLQAPPETRYAETLPPALAASISPMKGLFEASR